MVFFFRVLNGFLNVGTSGHQNDLTGTSEAIMVGRRFSLGTGSVELISRQGDILNVEEPVFQHLNDFPLPSIDVSAIHSNFPENIREYIQTGPQLKQPLIQTPIPKTVKPKKVKITIQKVKKPKKVVVPRRKWTEKNKSLVNDSVKQTKMKKGQKIPQIQEEPKWSYDSVFQPARTPDRDV